jgi:predicted N-formylglutamate amidohydrolase
MRLKTLGDHANAVPQPAAMSLLEPDEPPPVIVERAAGTSPYVLVVDHAGRHFPKAIGTLGVAPAELERHIAYDIGIWPVAREVARALDAPLVAQTYSRLVIDCNRPTHVAASIPEISEHTEIPGNRLVGDDARQARIESLFAPYHDAIAAILEARAQNGQPTVLIAMHSFTPVYMGAQRPWEIGLLYNRDPRVAHLALDLLAQDAALTVGDNLPYSVDDDSDYTLPVHGERRGLPHVGFEIRQDLIAADAGQEQWTGRMTQLLQELLCVLPESSKAAPRPPMTRPTIA